MQNGLLSRCDFVGIRLQPGRNTGTWVARLLHRTIEQKVCRLSLRTKMALIAIACQQTQFSLAQKMRVPSFIDFCRQKEATRGAMAEPAHPIFIEFQRCARTKQGEI
ncbi:hypothetical protein [Rhodoferax sediminis]|jgi:hypothetical protein|uniref:Uncharacterized protein n=1 Tax=Rhodoferax sediminis TaxID=2509614 RepID=A0A515DAD5_9BURK|nr:hypothetical protein [Rhodoferax sediminis]QDL37383.1 hypothetical protein EUB48_08940 [Rhodoferax sediminis]